MDNKNLKTKLFNVVKKIVSEDQFESVFEEAFTEFVIKHHPPLELLLFLLQINLQKINSETNDG